MVLGSASSTRIPAVVALVISQVVDGNLGLREAVLAPRVLWNISDGPKIYVEVYPPITNDQIAELKSFGYQSIRSIELPVPQGKFSRLGSVNAVHLDRRTRVLTGVADPRRNGNAAGAGG